ncbi:polysaccharide lyase family 8 super-sandwich domain-containing protein [Microlunatus sp. Y2014]|uniref:polysaccharide lyase family 8 super-sandwich domain-containing protein n=1 Tax=Microlunatus sp. Y2014 TaxID=3418488 RepID=UPI003DA6DF23
MTETHPTPTLSRRGVLGLGAGAVVGASAFSLFSPAPARAADDFDVILGRYAELLAGAADADVSHPDIQTALAAMNERTERLLGMIVPGPDRDRVFSDLPLTDLDYSLEIQSTALQLSSLAQGWAAPGTAHHHDPTVAEAVVAGLRTLHDLQYNVDQEEFGNWYHWEIGGPRGIVEAATLIRSELPDDLRVDLTEAVHKFNPDPGFQYPPGDPRHTAASGSNLLFICQNATMAGALARNGDRIQLASDRAVPALEMNTAGTGNGFYFDGSFIAHNNIPYTASYGRALLTASSYLVASLGGTRWDLDPATINPLRTAVGRCFLPWLNNAQNLPPVSGRNLGNGNLLGDWMIGSILMLAEGAPTEQAALWHGSVKGHLERTEVMNFFTERTFPEALLAQRLLTSEITGLPEELGPKLFPEMDRIMARGDGWCYTLATASSRTRGYETMSRENIKGWHQGSAARYLHLDSDQWQYLNHFPTLDPFRYAGTTVDSQFLDYEKNSAPTYHAFVGGSQVGGQRLDDGFYARPRFASWVQQLSSRDSTMTAKLSWFFLDDVIVHLGADIRGGSGAPIETILENRALKRDEMKQLHVNGRPVSGAESAGWRDTRDDVRSITVPGAASLVMLGDPIPVHFLHEARSGRFSDLSPNRGSSTLHHNDFHTIWLDHGPSPDGADFSYLYLPLASPARAEQLAADPGLQVIRNDATVQAVRCPRLGVVVAANFHAAATVSSGGYALTAPSETSVTIARAAGRDARSVELGLSAPSQQQDRYEFSFSAPGRGVTIRYADPSVDVTVDGSTVTLTVDTADHDGRSHHVELTW